MLAREHERKGTTCSAVGGAADSGAARGEAIIMSKLSALSVHPFRNAGLCVVIGVVSFVLASTVMPQGAHILWPALFWFLIPLVMLVTVITLLVLGIVRRSSRVSA
jgi:hypothetical protein